MSTKVCRYIEVITDAPDPHPYRCHQWASRYKPINKDHYTNICSTPQRRFCVWLSTTDPLVTPADQQTNHPKRPLPHTNFSLRQVSMLFGRSNSEHYATVWLRKGWLRGEKKQREGWIGQSYAFSREEIMHFLTIEEAWPMYQVEAIADWELRQLATNLRLASPLGEAALTLKPKIGRKQYITWTPEEDAAILAMRAANVTWDKMVDILKHDRSSLRRRYNKLQLQIEDTP